VFLSCCRSKQIFRMVAADLAVTAERVILPSEPHVVRYQHLSPRCLSIDNDRKHEENKKPLQLIRTC